MSDISDAIGTASEGGLYSRAVSRGTGAGKGDGKIDETGHFAESTCLNCGTQLMGSHCHACGQKAHLHRTLSAIGHDLMHGVLHLDGKLWHTLPLLALNPGKLTRRYIDGERATFVSPMAMFLFSVFLMFAVFQAVGLTTPTDIDTSNLTELSEEMQTVRDRMVAEREDLSARLADASGSEAAQLQSQVDDLDAEIEGLDAGRDVILGKEETSGGTRITIGGNSAMPFMQDVEKKWRKNPGLMLYKLQTNSYKFSWLLIPLSLPFVWLLFAWKRRFQAYDHAVFVTYSLAFMSLLFIALSLLGKIGVGSTILFTLFATIAPAHIFRQIKQAYELTTFSAVWRSICLYFFVLIVLLIFLQLLVLLGAF